ncbi:phage minor tail protein G [Vibrio sp. H11]|uniref:phage minor tail protein domain-containing protein n=1 Tax=Vibrio sp. H11 TaxID=2565928 RepID=UPI0010A67AE1|nr:phage minor tail protein G [Vibrio sp. H11]
MTASFLSKKTVPVGDGSVTVTQLSGLERYEYIEYTSNLEQPTMPVKPDDSAPESEKQQYLDAMAKVINLFGKITFQARARLVAYGMKDLDMPNLDERHQYVMAHFTEEHINTLHDEVALFSGIPLPKAKETAEEPKQTERKEGPIDPKA